MHERFHREVWAFKSDFVGALAKWLVRQSPYDVPDNLSVCLGKFAVLIDHEFDFDEVGMCKVELLTLTEKVDNILQEIPEIMKLNERKNEREGNGFSSRHSAPRDPDDDFIDITAVAQNITCEFADRADAEDWLDRDKDL